MGGVAVAAAVLIALVAVGAGATGTGQPATPHYVEEAVAAGLDHRYDGDFQYFVGGGVATFDCNDDGLPDVYLAGGSGPAALFRNRSPIGGALRFERVASPVTDLDAVTGAYPLDVDGDGITDLAVLRVGESVDPARPGRLPVRTRQRVAGARRRRRLDGRVLGDVGGREHAADAGVRTLRERRRPGRRDLHVPAQRADPARPPRAPATRAPIPLSPGWCPLSMLFSDWSRSGRADLRVSNDRHYYTDASGGEEQLWRIGPGAAPRLYTAADGWKTLQIWGMGIASQDLDGDGYPEIYLTSQADKSSRRSPTVRASRPTATSPSRVV